MSADFTMFLKRGCTTSTVFGPYVMAFVGQVDPHSHYFGSMNERGVWADVYSEAFMWTKVARPVVGHGQQLCVALKFNACSQEPFQPRFQEHLREVDRLENEVHVTLAVVKNIAFVRPLFILISRVCPNLLTGRYQVEILNRCISPSLKKDDGSSCNLSVKGDAIARDLRRVRDSWVGPRVQWGSHLHVTLSQTARMWRVPPSTLAGIRFVATMAPLSHRPKPSAQQSLGAHRGSARADVANRGMNLLRDIFSGMEQANRLSTAGRIFCQELVDRPLWPLWYEQHVTRGDVVLVLPYCCVNGQVCYLCDPEL